MSSAGGGRRRHYNQIHRLAGSNMDAVARVPCQVCVSSISASCGVCLGLARSTLLDLSIYNCECHAAFSAGIIFILETVVDQPTTVPPSTYVGAFLEDVNPRTFCCDLLARDPTVCLQLLVLLGFVFQPYH